MKGEEIYFTCPFWIQQKIFNPSRAVCKWQLRGGSESQPAPSPYRRPNPGIELPREHKRNSKPRTNWGKNSLMGVSLPVAFLKWATAVLSVVRDGVCPVGSITPRHWRPPELGSPCARSASRPPLTPKHIALHGPELSGKTNSAVRCVASHAVTIPIPACTRAGACLGWARGGCEDALPRRGEPSCSPASLLFYWRSTTDLQPACEQAKLAYTTSRSWIKGLNIHFHIGQM